MYQYVSCHNITGCRCSVLQYLHGYPVLLLLHVDRHGEVADLSGPHKPVALENPVKK